MSERDGHRLTETLIIHGERIVCRMCGTDCGDRHSNYKDGLVRRDLPVTAAGPLICPPEHHVDAMFGSGSSPARGAARWPRPRSPVPAIRC
jgi:hypothetical protein